MESKFEKQKRKIEEAKMNAGQEEDRLPVSVLSEVVFQLLNLPSEMRVVVCMRFSGMPYRDIALLQGVTMSAVEVRHSRAMKRWPALNALFSEKAAKQVRRKK